MGVEKTESAYRKVANFLEVFRKVFKTVLRGICTLSKSSSTFQNVSKVAMP